MKRGVVGIPVGGKSPLRLRFPCVCDNSEYATQSAGCHHQQVITGHSQITGDPGRSLKHRSSFHPMPHDEKEQREDHRSRYAEGRRTVFDKGEITRYQVDDPTHYDYPYSDVSHPRPRCAADDGKEYCQLEGVYPQQIDDEIAG